MANIPSRRYTATDCEKFEELITRVSGILRKAHLHSSDVLAALRYSTPKFRWDDELAAARETCVQYETYRNSSVKDIEERYGSDDE